MDQNRNGLPDFDHFTYKIATRPVASKLIAWSKLEEGERRLAMYEWAEARNDLTKAAGVEYKTQ